MQIQKDRWKFFQAGDNRTPLTAAEIAYWKKTFYNIIKVGQEFELNLTEQKGTCKGDNNACPCESIVSAEECWQQCANKSMCEMVKTPLTCKLSTDTCEVEDCETCSFFDYACEGMLCPNFVTACIVCEHFKTNCNTCPSKYDPNKSPEKVRENMKRYFTPTNSYGKMSRSGVHSITTDGSLLGGKGVEIITNGRRIDYYEFYRMAKDIIDTAVSKGAYTNERCSIHMHMLASYYKGNKNIEAVSELEKPVPEIILANFHQLVRRYQNAMTWMMTGLDDPKKLTRWEKFRVSVIPISSAFDNMAEVKSRVHANSEGRKYGWVNYDNLMFDENCDITRFHIEMRALDCILCPSAIAAFSCMYFALLIKAIEISKYGVLEIFSDKHDLERALEIKEALMNNRQNWDADRFSDTSKLEKYYDALVSESLDLTRILKPILSRIGPAYSILESLAIRPVSIRRCEGEDWQMIEDALAIPRDEEDAFQQKVMEAVNLQIVIDCNNLEEWVDTVTLCLKEDGDFDEIEAELGEKVKAFVMDRTTEGRVLWSNELGSIIPVE